MAEQPQLGATPLHLQARQETPAASFDPPKPECQGPSLLWNGPGGRERFHTALLYESSAFREREGLFDHCVRPGQNRRGDLDPECLSGLEVDHQVELRGLDDGEIRGLLTL